jgi:conjugative relaxase-like TrwC/TraI family protein
MIRMKPVRDAKKAESYYGRTDGGYYLDGLHREWGGKAAAWLGLTGTPTFDQFKNLIRGLDPHTGEQLTARLNDNRLCGWDVTGSVPKGVTLALERGDDRIHAAIWESVREAMGMVEGYATCRVRVGGQQADRVTGNLVWYAVEHPDTRPTVDESLPEGHRWREMPLPDRHVHVVVANETYDAAEDKWKAVKFRPVMDIRRFFDRAFDTVLAGKLADLGYDIQTRRKPGGKYYSWDIEGIPASLVAKNSRRSREIDELEAALVAKRKEAARLDGDPDWEQLPDNLSAVAKDKLGATSRRLKRDDLTLAECRDYWASLYTPEEADAVDEVIRRARAGGNARPDRGQAADKAVAFALKHHSEKESVIRWEQLAATAMERSIGAAPAAEIERAAQRLGVIFAEKNGQRVVTTEELQAEERYLAGVAAAGRSSVAPIGVSPALQRGKSNDEQWAAVEGLLSSSNRVNLVLGPAGAGKSHLLQTFDDGVRLAGKHVTYLATTAKAVKVLKKDGFEVNTLARFLVDERLQKSAACGRVVVDEASMAGHADAVRLFRLAEKLDLKLILVGDKYQHGSVPRGALLHVLADYGKVTPFRLTKIMRQEDAGLRAAAQLLSEGRTLEGLELLDAKGCLKEIADDGERYREMAAAAVASELAGNDTLVISPTHAEAGLITAEIRRQLREAGRLGEDHKITRLVAAEASEAERGLASTYLPGDVLIFHKEAAGFARGQRYTVTDPALVPVEHADAFQLYRPDKMAVAAGDRVRFTGTVKAMRGDATYKNGDTHTVAAITPGGNLRLDDGQVVSAECGLLRPAWVETSFGAQGQTTKHVILGMASMSAGAMNQEQAYVSATRAKRTVSIFTDDKEILKEAAQRSSQRLAALDLLPDPPPEPPARPRDRWREQEARKRRQAFYERLHAASRPVPQPERQAGYGRGR